MDWDVLLHKTRIDNIVPILLKDKIIKPENNNWVNLNRKFFPNLTQNVIEYAVNHNDEFVKKKR